jgi:glutaconate CoA-transferase subunit A
VEPGRLVDEGPLESIRVSRIFTEGVVEAPLGAHFTHCVPDYDRDEALQREYAASAKEADAWAAFRAKYIDIPEPDYRALASASLSGDAGGASPSAAQPESTRQGGMA